MKKFFKNLFEYIPIFSFVMIILSFISLIFMIIFINSTSFADFFNLHMASVVRFLMAKLTTWIPFSLAEILIITLPIWTFLLIFFAIKQGKKGKKPAIRYFLSIISIVLFVFITFVWTYSSGFHTTTVDKQLNLETESIGKDDLYSSSKYIVENLNKLSNEIEYDENGSSRLTYSYGQLSKKICEAYKNYADKYGTIKTFSSSIKPIILSEPMTYTHISGIYTFMTGEGNINTNYPDFVVVASCAHELSHQRGIARENEANFTAFVVLINSDDAYLQYCGYLDVYSNVLNALYSEDKDLYKEVVYSLDSRVKQDLINYSEFFKKYSDSKAAEITDKVNDSYLQANGQQSGTKSYGMIVEITCAYLKKYKMN